MSENQPSNAEILRELGKIKEGQNDLRISVGKMETSMSYIKWIAIIGFSASIAVATFLDQKQSAKISQVENRLDANFAIQRNTACQCEKEN